jgi:hypothetical protein
MDYVRGLYGSEMDSADSVSCPIAVLAESNFWLLLSQLV